MLSRLIIACVFSASLAACGMFSGDTYTPVGTAGSSGPYSAMPSGASAPRTGTIGSIGGIDNGQYPGAMEGAAPTGGSSSGVGAGPPGGIANNQMDRISQ